ncbi:MAG: tRNA epoxyqueuosine(34) reductase QueG [Sedimentisphaerales bacterium]|nr:tRNA epoxyqueuosine(34) reductase QueG [Sedimentisphaerales bacterium]
MDAIGFTSALPVDSYHAVALHDYLGKGYQGDMQYLARDIEKRLDVRRLVPSARSVICTALNYYQPVPEIAIDDSGRRRGRSGRVARYAWGRDYHDIVRDKLRRLAGQLAEAATGGVITRCFVDTAPLWEKAYAARAGLGWIGKNTLLLNERFGSWLVLGEIVTDLELAPDEPASDRCGDCSACLAACPTGALVEKRVLDARRCISYLTVESGSEVPPELQAKMGNRLFGCDACQEACPFNRQTPPTREAAFAARNASLDVPELLACPPESLPERLSGTSLGRCEPGHLRHLAEICRKNSP